MALLVLALPVLSMRTGMPSIKVVPPGDHSRQGYEQIQAGFGPGAPGALQIVAPASAAHQARDRGAERTRASSGPCRPSRAAAARR